MKRGRVCSTRRFSSFQLCHVTCSRVALPRKREIRLVDSIGQFIPLESRTAHLHCELNKHHSFSDSAPRHVATNQPQHPLLLAQRWCQAHLRCNPEILIYHPFRFQLPAQIRIRISLIEQRESFRIRCEDCWKRDQEEGDDEHGDWWRKGCGHGQGESQALSLPFAASFSANRLSLERD